MTDNLVDAVLAKVGTLSRNVVAVAAAPATAAPRKGTAAQAAGELCTAVRAYCELVSLGRPAAIGTRHLHTATSAPVDALEALVSAFCRRPSAAKTSAAPRESPWAADAAAADAAAAVVTRLEEVVLCSIMVTAGGVTVVGLEKGGAAAGGAGAGGAEKKARGGGGGGEDGGDAVAPGMDADDGVRQCASALRRLVLLGLPTGGCGDGMGDDGGGGKSGGSKSSNGYGCYCCAALYAALLLRGSRFDAVADVVGEVLGAGAAPPPLSGPEGAGALEALRDAAVAASESEFPCPPPSSPRLRPSLAPPRPASAASTASSSSPSVSPRGGPVSARQRGTGAGAGAAVPPLSLATAVPANSSRARPRSWSMGSGGGAGAEAAAAAAAATSLAEETRAAAAAAAAGGAGWFSEGALADFVKALPPCAGAGIGAVKCAAPAASGVAAAAVSGGGGRWRYGPVDCVEEALEQVCLVGRLTLAWFVVGGWGWAACGGQRTYYS